MGDFFDVFILASPAFLLRLFAFPLYRFNRFLGFAFSALCIWLFFVLPYAVTFYF